MGLKINLHITQKCNYHCRYCFAHFEDKKDLSVSAWKRIIDNIAQSGEVDAINFAGGEPVLYKGFPELLAYAREKCFRLSVISNGSLMRDPVLMPPSCFSFLDTLGISVDSVDPRTLVELGACTMNHEVLTREKITDLVRLARSHNPSIRIKVNTVVTNLNCKEDVTGLGRELGIDRWKMLRMKTFKNEAFSNEALLIGEEEFASFAKRHDKAVEDVVAENNMARSYIMVDNSGQLLDNVDEDYHAMGNLLYENFSDVFRRYSFDRETYESRYAKTACRSAGSTGTEVKIPLSA